MRSSDDLDATNGRPTRATVASPLTDRRLGDFLVKEKIGEGGFGAVYRAHQSLLGRDAVIKVLHASHRDRPDVIQRFNREARLASRLDHPYAAHIYAYGAEPDGLLWIAMELVRGTPLDQILRAHGPLSPERLAPLLERICEVVHSAHEAGIVHRDLKPANVMVVARSGRMHPKLLDFGIARLAEDAETTPTPTPAPAPDSGATDDTVVGEPTPASSSSDPRLTAAGSTMGTPAYMAPELWNDARLADRRTDLYALGVMAYELLTGRRPFTGVTFREYKVAHRDDPIPRLGPGGPAALDEVLGRALAKDPIDRFGSVLELSTAFRAAIGLADDSESLPQLDEGVHDLFVNAAPQPLAEAVAQLETVRNVHQARDALAIIVRVIARWLGVLALSCRSRTGPGGASDSPQAIVALRGLRRGELEDDEWLALARELTRPFAARAEAHPIPELVGFLHRGDALGELAALLARLHATTGAPELRELYGQALRALGRALDAMVFVTEYRLVVPDAAGAMSWMGVRRPTRALVAISPQSRATVAPGEPLLVDRWGTPVLLLAPLAQIASPAPRAPDELFLLAGKGRLGARLSTLPFGLEREDDKLWEWLKSFVLADDSDSSSSRERDEQPYRGLEPFTAAHARLFFGREREVLGFVNRVRTEPVLAVVGPSGAGKSSFVQAGVIPALPRGWRAITVRPGPRPLAALAARCAAEGVELGAILHRDTVGEKLRAAAAALGETWLLVVDQLEEVLTMCLDPGERELYADTLVNAARSPDDPVRVVFTVRDDFLMRVEELAPLRLRLAHGLELLTTPGPAELHRILVEPAERAGYEFEDAALVDDMVAQVTGMPGALALLSFTAAELWQLRDRHFKQLTRKAYQAMGGVGGALAQHAEQTLGRMTVEEQRLVREVFRHLITSDGTRATMSRADLVQLLGAERHAGAVLDALVAARLLVSSESPQGDEQIEVVHEALIAAWPRLLGWRREDAEGARLRDQLRAAARQWQDRGRPRGLLWRGEALAEYRLWRARHGGALTDVESAFGAASVTDETRGRRFRLSAVATAFVVLAGVAFAFFLLYRQNRTRTAELELDQGRRALLDGDPVQASGHLDEARRLGLDRLALRYLRAHANRMLSKQELTLRHGEMVNDAVFSPDGKLIATAADDGARLWDANSGAQLAVLADHGRVKEVSFSPTGELVATAGHDGTCRIWDVERRTLVRELGANDPLYVARFSPDGGTLAIKSPSVLTFWDTASWKQRARIEIGSGATWGDVAFSHDGGRITTTGWDGTVRIWDVNSGALTVRAQHDGFVTGAVFDRTDTRIVTAGFDSTARIFDAHDGVLLRTLRGHSGRLRTAEFNADATRVLTASDDGTAKIWDATSGDLILSLETGGPVSAATFGRDGATLFTITDAKVMEWDAQTGRVRSILAGHGDAVQTIALSGDARAVIASADGTAKVWRIAVDDLQTTFSQGNPLWTAAFVGDGQRVMTSSSDGSVKLWDASSGALLETHAGPIPCARDDLCKAFTRDGRRVVTLAGKRGVIWDLEPGTAAFELGGHGAAFNGAAIAPDGERVATAGEDGTARLWSLRDGELVRTFASGAPMRSVGFDRSGERLVTGGGNGSAVIWDVRNGARLVTMEGHRGAVNAASFSGDGALVITGGDDRTARVWNARTGALVRILSGHRGEVVGAAFHPRGGLIVTSAFDGTTLWDAETGEPLTRFNLDSDVFAPSVEFSADGRHLLTSSYDGHAHVWDVSGE